VLLKRTIRLSLLTALPTTPAPSTIYSRLREYTQDNLIFPSTTPLAMETADPPPAIAHRPHSASDSDADANAASRKAYTHFPIMNLPAELRLAVYDHVTGETRRRLPLRYATIYYTDLDLSLLQTSHLIAEEASRVLDRQRQSLVPHLVISLTSAETCESRDIKLWYTRHVIQMLVEGHYEDLRQCEIARGKHHSILGQGLTRFLHETTSVVCGNLRITDLQAFHSYYRRAVQQLRNHPKIVLRVLMDASCDFEGHGMDFWWWSRLNDVLNVDCRGAVKLRIVFVVRPRHLERYRAFTAQPNTFPSWFTEDMWSIEVADHGLDPALD